MMLWFKVELWITQLYIILLTNMANTIKIGSNSISGIKFGTADVDAVYIGTNLVWSGATPPSPTGIPSSYTEVEYVENKDYAYLDLGFKPNQDTRLLFDMQIVTSTNYGKLISSGKWDAVNGIQLQYETGVNGTLKIDWGTTTSHYNTNVQGDLNRHIYDWNKNEFYRDGTLVGSTTYGNFQCTCNLIAFQTSSSNCTVGTSSNERLLARLYYFKIYDNGTLVRDLVPCVRNSDNKAGLYDLVGGQFYSSANSGYEFVAGPIVLPSGYTVVEYIQNTGHSYIDTDFIPNQDTRIVCDMKLDSSDYSPRLWGAGAWNSSSGLNLDYESGTLRISWLGNGGWTNINSVMTNFDRHVYDLDKNVLYVDGTSASTYTLTSMTTSDNLAIFTYIYNGRPSSTTDWNNEFFRGKMYSFKVYDNGTLVRNYIPCIRDNDSKVGAYDIVNDVFYTVPTGYTTDQFVAPSVTPSTPKWVATYSDSSTSSAECGSAVISYGEISTNDLVAVKIGDCVTSIDDSALMMSSSLTSVTIGSGVTSISGMAFYGCGSLTSITIYATTPPSLGGWGVFESTNDCPIYVPSGHATAYQNAWSDYASRIHSMPI